MFIVLEGIDCSGKSSVGKYMARELEEARVVEFPARSTLCGKEIDRALRGEIDSSAVVLQALMTINRLELLPYLMDSTIRHRIAVRWSPSMLVYGGLDGLPRCWLDLLVAPLPVPDLSILLDIPAPAALDRLHARGAPPEAYEKLETMKRARAAYLDLWREQTCKGDGRWAIVDANQSPNAVLHDCMQWYEATHRGYHLK